MAVGGERGDILGWENHKNDLKNNPPVLCFCFVFPMLSWIGMAHPLVVSVTLVMGSMCEITRSMWCETPWNHGMVFEPVHVITREHFTIRRRSTSREITWNGRMTVCIATGTWYNARVSKSLCEYNNGAVTFYFAEVERARDQTECLIVRDNRSQWQYIYLHCNVHSVCIYTIP